MSTEINTSNAALEEFWLEAKANLHAQALREEEEMSRALDKARADITGKISPEILEALGLDVARIEWPERHDSARVKGSCVFYGESIVTAVTADRYGRVTLYVDGGAVPATDLMRAQVGLALAKAAQKRQEAKKADAKRLIDAAKSWNLTAKELQNRNLTPERAPFLTPDALALVRRTVAERKWLAHREKWSLRHAEEAKRAKMAARADAFLAVCHGWGELYDRWDAECHVWASRWTAALEATGGPVKLWKVTYGMPGEEDGYLTAVVMEGPDDLTANKNGLMQVTEVTSFGGKVREVWIGAVHRVEPVEISWPSLTDGLLYHRQVRCGRFFVNVPPTAPKTVRPERDRPVMVNLVDWLEENGFKREAGELCWREMDGEEIAEMDEDTAWRIVVSAWN